MQVKRVEKPWGHEIWWAQTERYVGKLLFVRAGHKLSLQYHERKDETIHLQRGAITLVIGEGESLVERRLEQGESFRIKPGTIHRFIAVEDSEILEVSTPEVEDVIRLDDDYGRAGGGSPGT